MIEVICYGTSKMWRDRNEAIAFYMEGILSCDGAEQERYIRVYMDLLAGKTVCSDGYERRR